MWTAGGGAITFGLRSSSGRRRGGGGGGSIIVGAVAFKELFRKRFVDKIEDLGSFDESVILFTPSAPLVGLVEDAFVTFRAAFSCGLLIGLAGDVLLTSNTAGLMIPREPTTGGLLSILDFLGVEVR